MFITAPKTQFNNKTGAAGRLKDFSFIPLNSKTAGQSTQCFAFAFQNTLQHNSSADKNKTNQTSNAFRENEKMIPTQFQSEKGRNKTTKITVPNSHLENCSHIPVQFDNNQFSTIQKIQTAL